MAEPQKGTSSAVNSKEKNLVLGDMDFGEDFFTSWNSKTVSGHDAMDFDFGTVSKGNKKAFNFDKMDVDFSLDGDLGKISSFKVDMSDLDISSPMKKSGTGGNPKAEAGDGNRQKKQDRFKFSFDFNELDSFQFEPSLSKEGDKAGKNKDNEETSNKGEYKGSRAEKRDIIGASDSLNSNLSKPEDMAMPKVKPTVGDLGKFDFIDHSLSLDTREDGTSDPPPNQNLVEPAEVTSPQVMSDSRPQEIMQDATSQEERALPGSYKETTQEFSVKSVSGDQAMQIGRSETQAEASSRPTNDTFREQISNRERVASPELESSLSERQETSMTKVCSGDSERKNNGDNGGISIGNKDGSEPAQGVADSADTSSSNTSGKSMCGSESSREHQNRKSEGQVPSPNSETSKSIETNEKGIASVHSKYFKRLEGKESQFRQRQSRQTALSMFPVKLIGSKQQTVGLRDTALSINAQGDKEVVRVSESVCGEITTIDGEQESAGTVRGLKDIGECLNADGLLNGGKTAGFSRPSDKEIRVGEPVRGSEKNTKNLVTLSSALKSSTTIEKISKPTTQSHATSKTVLSSVSSTSLLNNSGKVNKAYSPKEIRSLADLSGLKRASVESRCPSSSAVQKETNSSRNLMQIREVKKSAPSKNSPSISTEKPSWSSPSLKRKTYEASNVDTPNIKSLKRFSPSPTENRTVKELVHDAKKEAANPKNLMVRSNESMVESNKGGHLSPTLDSTREVNFINFKMPLGIENDDNVEKAEAYAKDLEDICNMLRKKHEEAKELLVRAVVNNNNLLMLNHPIYQEKMCKIQKFAVQLMSKEVHA